MKTFLLMPFLFINFLFAQENQEKEDNKYFVVLYTIGENWDTTKQTHEQLYFKEHSNHLSQLRKNKIITIGGRYSNTGLIILLAKDEKEANELVTNDAAIKNKIFRAEIFSFNAFYRGCI